MKRLILVGLITLGLGVGIGLPPATPVSADACTECYDAYFDIPLYTWEDYLQDVLDSLTPMGPIGP